MKFISATLLLSTAAIASAGEGHDDYVPKNDVTKHSRVALDTIEISALIDAGNSTAALDIYANGRNSEGKNLQSMAQKDWVEAGIDDITEYNDAAALFYRDGAHFLDSYNRDAMTCTGSFAGQTEDMCKISAKKNLLCTSLLYAQYEGVKAIQYGNEKNWDEMFAFWNGVYDESDENAGKGAPGDVQSSRDGDFSTEFRHEALDAIIEGQKAFSDGAYNKEKLTAAYEDFKKAVLSTFAQATLKYSAQFDEAGLTQDKIDKKWGEGYTYFRCGAGLMNPELALYINYVLDPRDKLGMTLTPMETHCKIVKKMLSLPDIGMGLKIEDLSVAAALNIQESCGLENLQHAEAPYSAKKSESERAYLPVIGFLVVIGMYVGGYYATKKNHQD